MSRSAAKLYRSLEALPAAARGGAIAIGNFDGVHLGHARLMERLREQARRVGGPALAFTFEPHPAALLRPEAVPPPLTWLERKASLLAEQGVDAVIAYPTDLRLLSLNPQEFFQQILLESLQVRAVVEGPNFNFGKDRAGNIDTLRSLCERSQITLEVVPPILHDGDYISSSRVRSLIASGEVAAARRMLTQPYRIRGKVVYGAQRGGKIGFPTANLAGIDTLLPTPAVYACRAFAHGAAWPAAVNLGGNPTFGEAAVKFEAHLIGFAGDLYGQMLEVDFLARLRDIQQFASLDALRSQLERDLSHTRRAFDEASS